ncbi:hypothetical protein GIB67_027993 [Kingdonia uniflora]|uniref:RNase H type-1 domain-containing protein n=1 Tax=Kingdonia uniflora TaxID=39325 RepID=A0A7J7L715_9MAGN|nr:hypothetical protein GIB67_027993 [Kingdonia uniflora]
MGITTSYEAECEAILAAARKAFSQEWFTLLIRSDSQAAVTAYQNNKMPWQFYAQWDYFNKKMKIRLQNT